MRSLLLIVCLLVPSTLLAQAHVLTETEVQELGLTLLADTTLEAHPTALARVAATEVGPAAFQLVWGHDFSLPDRVDWRPMGQVGDTIYLAEGDAVAVVTQRHRVAPHTPGHTFYGEGWLYELKLSGDLAGGETWGYTHPISGFAEVAVTQPGTLPPVVMEAALADVDSLHIPTRDLDVTEHFPASVKYFQVETPDGVQEFWSLALNPFAHWPTERTYVLDGAGRLVQKLPWGVHFKLYVADLTGSGTPEFFSGMDGSFTFQDGSWHYRYQTIR